LDQVAYRWKTQFNENSKVMSSSAVMPEIGHNEFEAFSFLKKRAHTTSAVILRESQESLDTKVRLNALRAKLENNSVKIFVVKGRGKSLLERMLYLVYYGDFVSVYLALLSGSDPEAVQEIQWLKNVVRNKTSFSKN
ncbi:MAG: SIS domain-containing protein, partial [Candidatus Bathyarchaeia archaeon]